jgi:hypothetical protein
MDPLQKALQEAGALMVKTLQQELRRSGKVATGNLVKSISFKISGNSITLSGLPYLKWVDEGRKPGKMPPVSKILPWVRVKKITFSGKTQEQTAWGIAKSIGKKGIKATGVIASTRKKTSKQVSKIISKGLSQMAMQRVRDSFK